MCSIRSALYTWNPMERLSETSLSASGPPLCHRLTHLLGFWSETAWEFHCEKDQSRSLWSTFQSLEYAIVFLCSASSAPPGKYLWSFTYLLKPDAEVTSRRISCMCVFEYTALPSVADLASRTTVIGLSVDCVPSGNVDLWADRARRTTRSVHKASGTLHCLGVVGIHF
jgi:hypothetical protein